MSAPAPAAPRRARTRTGCKTCRQRKLKCDEVKPICGHCRKSNRECQPSEGIAFRHAQNAGLNDQQAGQELGNFYKYRQKFENTFFLPIPQDLQFVHVTDVYADEPNTTSAQSQTQSQAQAHAQSQQHHSITQHAPSSSYQHPQYVDVAATSLKAMIDPNLESGTGNNSGLINNGGQDSMTVAEMTESESLNETILNALKQSDAEMSMRGQAEGH